jgi:transcriptional regulator GlxA family with amidase domain
VEARVVDDGDVITAGGVTSGLDLALWLVERYSTPAIAQLVEKRMEYRRSPDVWTRAPAAQAKART